MNVSKDNELVDLGAVTEETKGAPIGNEPDTLGLRQKVGDGISDD
jgi:hypothetical protein